MNDDSKDYLSLLKNAEAILRGHFILSSGLHSDTYIQCAKIFADPKLAGYLCQDLANKIRNLVPQNIDYVVSPAMGGVVIGYEIARQLSSKAIFCERVNGVFEFRRGFSLKASDNVLIVEDVITTGKSSVETIDAIKLYGANILAEACLIDRRSTKGKLYDLDVISLIELDVMTMTENELTDELKNIPAVKPGSRFLQK